MKGNGKFLLTYGPWALVAGASAGLGAAYAEALARKGLNLVLVARREKELSLLADRLTAEYSVSVRQVRIDLASGDFLESLAPRIRDLDIGLVVYNATFPAIGRFADQRIADHMRLLDTNCRAPVRLIHHFCASMKKRRRSGIVLMSSLSAFQGTPLLSHYGASKAFILVLGEGLSHELAAYGIDLLVCCPGATRTENYLKSLPRDEKTRFIPEMEPRDVAEKTLAALGTRNLFIPGIRNRLASFLMRRIMSRKQAVNMMKSSAEGLYGKSR